MRFQRHDLSSRSFAALIVRTWMALILPVLGAIHSPLPALAHDDAHEIRSLIGSTWDKPDSKVVTDPIAISGDHAVASWTQGERGGRALLRREAKRWTVVLCSGDPLKAASTLEEAGVPHIDAQRIADDLAEAEARVPAARRAQFSLFEGLATINDMGEGKDHHGPISPGHEMHKHHTP